MIITVLAALTAVEFFYIFYLETIATASEKTAATFGMTVTALQEPGLNVAMKNQGVYNLGIGLIIIAMLVLGAPLRWLGAVMAFIILVAAYGSVTVDRSILLKQGGLAILTLAGILFWG